MKRIGVIILMVFIGLGTNACGEILRIPKNYVAISDSEAFHVELQYELVIHTGTSFIINVTSKNISGKDLYNETCSSLYRIGAKIAVYTEIEGKRFYLQDEFETLTDDIKIEKIGKGESVSHEWKFDGTLDVARHGTDDTAQRKMAPKGIYHISISNGKEIEKAFEII